MSRISLNKVYKDRDFTIVKNDIVRDSTIKPLSRILLIFLIGCDENKFTISTKSLASSLGVGTSSITSASKELQNSGYLIIEKKADGKCVWHIYEEPQLEKPDHEKPDHENPYMENHDALRSTNSKEELNNKKNKRSSLLQEGFKYFWQEWCDCKKRLNVQNQSRPKSSFEFFKQCFNAKYFRENTEDDYKQEVNQILDHLREIHTPEQNGFCAATNLKTRNYLDKGEWK